MKPAFAWALWAERADRPRLWLVLLLLLGARDGLVLVIGGIGLDLAWRRRWRWSAAAAGLAAAWLLLLSRWLYPWLRDDEGPKPLLACSVTSAAGRCRSCRTSTGAEGFGA